MIDPELIPLVAKRFKALGEPARLALLAALQQGERSVSELVEPTGRGQPNVSQHLKEMVHAGLVEARREGSAMYYRIADPLREADLRRGLQERPRVGPRRRRPARAPGAPRGPPAARVPPPRRATEVDRG